jgi:DNA-directed RNA polymerase specialized sigma24 family protein
MGIAHECARKFYWRDLETREDVTADVVCDLIKRIDRFKTGNSDNANWYYSTIARNLFHRKFRAAYRPAPVLFTDLAEDRSGRYREGPPPRQPNRRSVLAKRYV